MGTEKFSLEVKYMGLEAGSRHEGWFPYIFVNGGKGDIVTLHLGGLNPMCRVANISRTQEMLGQSSSNDASNELGEFVFWSE